MKTRYRKLSIASFLVLALVWLCFSGSFAAVAAVSQAATVNPGQDISISTAGMGQTADSWVGFYASGSTDSQYVSYSYLSKLTGDVYTVAAPKTLGTYEFRFFKDSGYVKTTTSAPTTVVQYTPTFSLNAQSVKPNEAIEVTYSGAPIFKDAWVGFYKVGAADTAYISFAYTDGASSGSYKVVAPKEAGSYEYRMFLDFGYTRIGTSGVVTVGGFTPQIAVNTAATKPGDKIIATYTNGPTNTDAWIGFYKSGDVDQKYQSYVYTKGQANGTYEVVAPQTAGTYEFRIFNDQGYVKLATSGSVTVSATAVVTPTPTTPVTKPAIPVITVPTGEVFASGVRLNWPITPGAIGYRVFRSMDPNALGISITDFYISGNTYADANVEASTTYYYTIKPVMAEANPTLGTEEKTGETIAVIKSTTGATVYKPGTLKQVIQLQLNNPYLTQNGQMKEIDPGRGTVPIVVSGRTMVPIRAIVEAMGGTIAWDGATKQITLNARGNVVVMWVGKTNITINGVATKMDVSPIERNGRTYVPVRFAAENLNSKVDWINSTSEVVIIFED